MIVFDVRNIVSLAHTAQWLEEAKDANPDTNPLIFLVATKRDLLVGNEEIPVHAVCSFTSPFVPSLPC